MTISDSLLDQVEVLVERGFFADREALLKDAIRALLRSRPELRRQLAIELYKVGETSLTRSAEIGGVDVESFKELLREAGIARTITPIGETIYDELEQLTQLQESSYQNEGSH